MTSKQFCERMYGMYKLLCGNGRVQCTNDRFSCCYTKENTVLTDAIIRACSVRNIPFTIDCNKHCVNFVVDFSK